MQGAVGLAIWVAAVGNQKKSSSRESSTLNGIVTVGSGEIPAGRVWRQAPGREAEIELITLGSDDDPNLVYISDEVLMKECQVHTPSLTTYLHVGVIKIVSLTSCSKSDVCTPKSL